jgi:hypothetical protein
MPYISESDRKQLDASIDQLVNSILETSIKNHNDFNINNVNSFQVLNMLGNINYCFSRILMKLSGDLSYTKIAMITGVIENIKQEFYRRAASWYEDKKIVQNGDIKEYKHLN